MFNDKQIEVAKYQIKLEKRLAIDEKNRIEMEYWLQQNLTKEQRLEFINLLNKHILRLQTLSFD